MDYLIIFDIELRKIVIIEGIFEDGKGIKVLFILFLELYCIKIYLGLY